MENLGLKIAAIEKSIEQMYKSISDKHPLITISKYSSNLPQLKCRLAESVVLRGHSEKISSLSWNSGSSFNNKILASASSDGSILFWNSHTGIALTKWVLPDAVLTNCKFEPKSGEIFSVSSFEGAVYLFKPPSQQEKKPHSRPFLSYQAHESYISEASFVDISHLVTASGDKSLKLWDLTRSESSILEFNEHREDVMCVDCTEGLLISGSCDHSVKLWDIRSGKKIRSFNIHLGDVNALKFISGFSFISGCADGYMRLMDLRGLNPLGHYRAGGKVESVEASYSGRILFSGSPNGDTRIWDIMDESAPIQSLPRFSPCIKLDCDSIYLAGTIEESVILWQHVIYN